MWTWLPCQLLLVWCIVVTSDKMRFEKYSVFLVKPNNEEQLNVLKSLADNTTELNFWVGPSGVNRNEFVMVPPQLQSQFKKMAAIIDLKSEVYITDVQNLIDTERPPERPATGFGWQDYYTLEEINTWLDSLAEQYPGVVTSLVAGQTYEGRQIKGVRVSYRSGNPGVILEGGMHAREWISPATVTYILNKLLTSQDPTIQDLARSFDFYVLPVTNPDGYVYSHTNNRVWRKTRSVTSKSCHGTDPNRNWDFHWREARASSDPCAQTFAGTSPFSEIETKSLAAYFTNISDKFDLYFSFHSFSQVLMFPYGHSSERISNYDEMLTLAQKAVTALSRNNGTMYRTGSIHEAMYSCTGSSMDWVKGVFNKSFVFGWELRDQGQYGFLLPASQIIDTGEETVASIVVILQHAKKSLHGNSS